jgi:hypothetical protein
LFVSVEISRTANSDDAWDTLFARIADTREAQIVGRFGEEGLRLPLSAALPCAEEAAVEPVLFSAPQIRLGAERWEVRSA